MSDLNVPTSSSPIDHSYRGVGGWLLFFIITLVFIAPANLIFRVLYAYEHSIELFSRSAHSHPFISYYVWEHLASFAVRGYGIYVGIRLWRTSPGAVDHARHFLLFLLLFAFVDYVGGVLLVFSTVPEAVRASALSNFLTGQPAKFLLQALVYSGVWHQYLLYSERVRATFPQHPPTPRPPDSSTSG
jgi:hypothetical protein